VTEISSVSLQAPPPSLNRTQRPTPSVNESEKIVSAPKPTEIPIPEDIQTEVAPSVFAEIAPADPSTGFPEPAKTTDTVEPSSIVRKDLLAGVLNEGLPQAKGSIISVKA